MKHASLVVDCPECGASVSMYLNVSAMRKHDDNTAYCRNCYALITVGIDVSARPQHKQVGADD